MKIQGYNAVVQGAGQVGATVKNVGDINAYGGTGKGYKALAGAISDIRVAYEKVSEEQDRRAIMQAMDIYNKGNYDILYNDETGVMNTKYEGAANSVGDYIEREKKLRNDIMGNLKLKTDKYKLVFADMANKSAEQGYRLVDKHQYKQLEAQRDITLNNNLENEIQFAQKNFGDKGIVDQRRVSGHMAIAERFEGMGEEYIKMVSDKFDNRLAGVLVSQAVAQGQYDRAEEVLKDFEGALTPEQMANFSNKLYAKKKQDYTTSLAENLYKKYGDNLGAIMGELRATNAFGSDEPMDLKERAEVFNLVQGIVSDEKAIKKNQQDNLFESAFDKALEMKGDGKSLVDVLKAVKAEAGADAESYAIMEKASRAAFTGNKNGRLSDDFFAATKEQLRRNVFDTVDEYTDFLQKNGAGIQDIQKGRAIFKTWRNGKGEFAYNWNDFKVAIMGNEKLSPAQNVQWQGAIMTAVDKIGDYIAKEKHEPSQNLIKEYLRESLNKTYIGQYTAKGDWLASAFELSPAELAYNGVLDITLVGYNLHEVKFDTGETKVLTTQELSELAPTAEDLTSE